MSDHVGPREQDEWVKDSKLGIRRSLGQIEQGEQGPQCSYVVSADRHYVVSLVGHGAHWSLTLASSTRTVKINWCLTDLKGASGTEPHLSGR